MVLRSKDPDGVRQEVWAHLLVHYAIRTLMHQAALGAEVDADRLSFTRSLPRVVKRKMSNFPLKRDLHRHWPQPTKPPGQAVVILTRTARGP